MKNNNKNFNFSQTYFGFETCKSILGVGSNTMSKLIDLNLVAVLDDDANQRNQKYAGYDIEYLTSARNRPLLIPEGEIALVCSMGIEEHNGIPSLYLSGVWDQYYDFLNQVQQFVLPEVWEKIKTHKYRITGEWRVKKEDADELVKNNSIVVASYGGFILDGARIVEELDMNQFRQKGGRYFIVEPFNKQDRSNYAHNYLESKQGPACKVVTSKYLQGEI